MVTATKACHFMLQEDCAHLPDLVSSLVRSVAGELAAETKARLARAANISPACGRSAGGSAVTVTSERSKGATAAQRATCSACSAESTSAAEQSLSIPSVPAPATEVKVAQSPC